MISNEGTFYFSPSFRAWKDHYRFDFLHRSLLREIWSLRSTSPHPISVGGITRILKEGEALLSVRRLVRETGIPRTTVQRAITTFVRRGLLRRVEKHSVDGIIFYIPHPMEIPELSAIRQYVLGQQGASVSSGNLNGFHTPTRSKRATSGHLAGQGLSFLSTCNSSGKNTRNANRGPDRGPDEENVNKGFKKETHREIHPQAGFGPSALKNDALDAHLNSRGAPSALKCGPLGLSSGQGPQGAAGEGENWIQPPAEYIARINQILGTARSESGHKPKRHAKGISEGFDSSDSVFAQMFNTGEFIKDLKIHENQIVVQTTSDNS